MTTALFDLAIKCAYALLIAILFLAFVGVFGVVIGAGAVLFSSILSLIVIRRRVTIIG